jgi:signal transduction histidine kinase
MMKSLHARILLAYTGLILFGFITLALIAGQQISSGAIEDYEHLLSEQAMLIARGLAETVEEVREGEMSLARLEERRQQYATQFGIQVSLLTAAGEAWVGDEIALPADPTALPEITAALNRQVTYVNRPGVDGADMIFTAAPILEDGEILGLVYLAAPLTAVQSLITQRWISLAAGVLLLALIALGAGGWLAASLTRPLTQLQAAARQIASGDFSQRVPATRTDEIGQLAATFNHMAVQVEAMLNEQRAFASNAAHELRTPLTAIRLRSEALRAGSVDADTAHQYIVEIDDEAARLGRLVQELMVLSRADAGRLEMGEEQIDPLRLARHLVRELAEDMAEKRLSLTLDFPEMLPPMIASTAHMQLVFRNLLRNALKYTPPGGTITWTLGAQNGRLQATIHDNGQGIAPIDLPHIFERFYRADKARTRQQPGVGLGLPLVRSILHVYGGEIVVKSDGVGQGTAVYLHWPLTSSQPR